MRRCRLASSRAICSAIDTACTSLNAFTSPATDAQKALYCLRPNQHRDPISTCYKEVVRIKGTIIWLL